MSFKFGYRALFASVVLIYSVANANEPAVVPAQNNSELDWEAPPQEAPYISDEEAADQIEAEISAGPTEKVAEPNLPPAPAPIPSPAKEIVSEPLISKKPPVEQASSNGTSSKTYKSHPLSKKGLIRIEKDGSYIYKTQTGTKNQSFSFKIASVDPMQIETADGQSSFETMYGSGSVTGLMFDYEWQPFTTYGKLGVQAGFGLTYSQGNGRFLNDGSEAKEKYTLFTIPLNLGGIYRFEYMQKQWVAPYVAGGVSYVGLIETRDDNKSPKMVGTPAAYGAGGVMVNITAFDRQMSFDLYSEYGVAAMWFVFEFRRVQSLSEDLDVSGNVINGGISVDF